MTVIAIETRNAAMTGVSRPPRGRSIMATHTRGDRQQNFAMVSRGRSPSSGGMTCHAIVRRQHVAAGLVTE